MRILGRAMGQGVTGGYILTLIHASRFPGSGVLDAERGSLTKNEEANTNKQHSSPKHALKASVGRSCSPVLSGRSGASWVYIMC